MSTEGCDRCAAEQRARRLRAVMRLCALVGIALCAVPCGACCVLSRGAGHSRGETAILRAAVATPVLVSLAVILVALVGVLGFVADRSIRRASALPPRPPPDPLASYRDGNGARECPAHPFATPTRLPP